MSVIEALALQDLLERVGEGIKDNPQGRSYLSPDGQAYVLAVGGDRARVMDEFMKAVGQYLVKVRNKRSNEAAKLELLHAFEQWLSQQRLY